MSKLESPETDFYEILQVRINELEIELHKCDTSDEVEKNSALTISAIIQDYKYMQQNFNSYSYRIRNKKQAD